MKSANSSSLGDSLTMERRIYHFKIILLGDVAVGKTSVLSRFTKNSFSVDYKCSVGVDLESKTVFIDEKTGALLIFWDTCGEERFRSVSRQYYKDANGILLIFDLTNRISFENLQTWLDDIKDYGMKDVDICILGNKVDNETKRVVPFIEAKDFADSHLCSYFEVSSKEGTNITLAFESLAKSLINKDGSDQYIEKEENSIEKDSKKIIYSNIPKREKESDKNEKCCS